MLRKLGFVCAALALFAIAGGPWAALQTVAWATMLRDYSRQGGGLAAAIEQTFDGQHPCALCREIQAAKAKEKRAPASSDSRDGFKVKALVAFSFRGPRACEPAVVSFPRAGSSAAPSRCEPPPTPPPRRETVTA